MMDFALRQMSARALGGLLVLPLEQAVAAPCCSSRLGDAGTRVIKVERAEGDFARRYDCAAAGLSSYFVWPDAARKPWWPTSRRLMMCPCGGA